MCIAGGAPPKIKEFFKNFIFFRVAFARFYLSQLSSRTIHNDSTQKPTLSNYSKQKQALRTSATNRASSLRYAPGLPSAGAPILATV